MLTKEDVNIFDLVEIIHYVHPSTEYKVRAIKMYNINKNETYFYLVTGEPFYLGNWRNLHILKIIKKIDATDDEKKLMIHKAMYINALNALKSRFYKENRDILSHVWKKTGRSKNLIYNTSKAFIEERNRRRGYDSGHNVESVSKMVGIWIINYTKSKRVMVDMVMGTHGLGEMIMELEKSKEEMEEHLIASSFDGKVHLESAFHALDRIMKHIKEVD